MDEKVQKTYYFVNKLLDLQGFSKQLNLYIGFGLNNRPFVDRWGLPFRSSEVAAEKAAKKLGSYRLMKIVADEMSKGSSEEQIAEVFKKEIEKTLKTELCFRGEIMKKDEDYLNWIINAFSFKIEEEKVFIETVIRASGFFKPNLEEITSAIERIQKFYNKILLQIKQTPHIDSHHTFSFSHFLESSIKVNFKWVIGIQRAVELKCGSHIVEFASEIKHNMNSDKPIFARMLKELEERS